MRNYEGIPQPESWDEITLKQFSEYNKLIADYEAFTGECDFSDDASVNQHVIKQIELNFNICEAFSKLPSEDVYALDIALVNEYVESLNFLTKEYDYKKIEYFSFDGVNYNIPSNIGLNTKFGQYIESLQAEMNTRYTDKNSVIYLAHQIAHVVDNGEEWDGAERDRLAEKFEELPASIGLDFSFFLSQKCVIYSQAYLQYVKEQTVKNLPFIKRTSLALVGLRRYMSLRNLKYSIDLINLRLTAFYLQILPKFSNIYRILRQRLITKMKLTK